MADEIDFGELFKLYPLSCNWLCYKLESNGMTFADYQKTKAVRLDEILSQYAMTTGKIYDFFANEDIFLSVLPCTFGFKVLCASYYRKMIVNEIENQDKAYALSIENGFILLEEQINIKQKLYM